MELLQENRELHHVHRRAELLVACRSSAREPRRQAEFVLFDLNDGVRAGQIEWDDHRCENAETTDGRLLESIHVLARRGPAGKSGARLLGFSFGKNKIGALYGEGSAPAQRLFTIEAGDVIDRCEAALDWDHPGRDRITDWLARKGRCRWLTQSESGILAEANTSAILLERGRSWDLEPFQDGDRSSLRKHAELLLDWLDEEPRLQTANCSVIRFGSVEVLSGSAPVFSVSVPCFGLALARDGELKTVFRRTDRPNQDMLSREGIGWLAGRFDSAISVGDGYLLDVSEVLELTHPSSATNQTVLFAWNTSSRAECSAVLPMNGQTGDRLAVVRDLLRDRGPDSNWQGESHVRATWSELGSREMAVLSRSVTGDCVEDFVTPPKHASLNNASQYKHFARARSRTGDAWTVVELGRDPAVILRLLDRGEEAAFFSLFQQTGGNVHGRSISIRPGDDIRYAISRDQAVVSHSVV